MLATLNYLIVFYVINATKKPALLYYMPAILLNTYSLRADAVL